jgi:stage II sporulation protein D
MIALALALAGSLFEQSAVRVLDERFREPEVNWVLMEAGTGRLIGARWEKAGDPIAVGSLVKPFTALAWSERHGAAFPQIECHGCWLARGHGKIGIIEAIAQSCNVYFEALTRGLEFSDVAGIAHRFGFAPPPESAPPAAWAGRDGAWQAAPLEVARAFIRLAADPGFEVVREGMAACARSGTGRAIGSGLVKTGTGPCSHARRAPGDGFVVALEPPDEPRYLLLVRVHGSTGAHAAATASKIFRETGMVQTQAGGHWRPHEFQGRTVRIGVFGLFRPGVLRVRPAEGSVRCELAGGKVACDDRSAAARIRLAARAFTLEVPGRIERRFYGGLEIRAEGGALEAVVEMPLETAVASAVSAESRPGAPQEALRAQAVVARSYYLAAAGRHARFDFCDTTHCQFLREPPEANSPAARAAETTRGLALAWEGRPVATLFTASCGGLTRALGRAGEYPFFAVRCPYCRRGDVVRCAYCVRESGAWPNRRGSGAGHGVGLCQAGATAMAESGASFRSILELYFPNTRLAGEY